MMNLFKKFFLFPLLIVSPLLITSCSDDDDDDHDHDHDHTRVVAPDTYEFERDGLSTVSFSGQTCRLQMAEDIFIAMNNENAATVDQFPILWHQLDKSNYCLL